MGNSLSLEEFFGTPQQEQDQGMLPGQGEYDAERMSNIGQITNQMVSYRRQNKSNDPRLPVLQDQLDQEIGLLNDQAGKGNILQQRAQYDRAANRQLSNESGVKSLSFDEFFGNQSSAGIKGDEPLPSWSTADNLKQTFSDVGDRLKGVPKATLQTAGVLGDMILGSPGALWKSSVYAGARATGLSAGEAEYYSNTLSPSGILAPVQSTIAALGLGEGTDETAVSKAMDLLTQGIKKGASWLSNKTNGAVPPEDFEEVTQALMGIAGIKGGQAIVKKVIANAERERQAGIVQQDIRRVAGEDERVEPTMGQEQPPLEVNIVGGRDGPLPPEVGAPTAEQGMYQNGTPAAIRVPGKPNLRPRSTPNQVRMIEEASNNGELLVKDSDGVLNYQPPDGRLMMPQFSHDLAYKLNMNGGIDPRLLETMGLASAVVAAGGWLYMHPEDVEKIGRAALAAAGALGGGALMAVKPAGGFWHPEAVTRLSQPLKDQMIRAIPGGIARRAEDIRAEFGREPTVEELTNKNDGGTVSQWADSRIRTYLNKHAGTEGDPLRDVKVPMMGEDVRWEDLMDQLIKGKEVLGPRGSETQWNFNAERRGPDELPSHIRLTAITSYLSHVGDVLREGVSSVPDTPREWLTYRASKTVKDRIAQTEPADIQDRRAYWDWVENDVVKTPEYQDYLAKNPMGDLTNYDLVRAVKLTEQVDLAAKLEMAKNRQTKLDASKKITNELPASAKVKEYPDGSAWYKIDNTLPEDQIALNLSVDTELCALCVGGVAHGKWGYKGWVPARNIVTREKVHPNAEDTNGYIDGVKNGEAQIYSLRKANGEVGATIEVQPTFKPVEERMANYQRWGVAPEDIVAHEKTITPPDIIQIKGSENKSLVGTPFEGRVQDFVRSGPLREQPFIGYLTKDGKWESYNQRQAEIVDYHHSHLVQDLDAYDRSLRFVRMGGKNEYTIVGEAAIDPRMRGAKEVQQLAQRLLDNGADPKAPMVVGDMKLPTSEAPFQGKSIGTLENLAGKEYVAKGGKWGEVGDLENTGLIKGQDVFKYDDMRRAAVSEGFDVNKYYTKAELDEHMKSGSWIPKEQTGNIDPKLLTRMAVLGIGAYAGAKYDKDSPIAGAVIGALGATVGLKVAKRSAVATWDAAKALFLTPGSLKAKVAASALELVPGPITKAFATDKRLRIAPEMNERDALIAKEEQFRGRVVPNSVKLVPDATRRGAISHFLENDPSVTLTPVENSVAVQARRFFDRLGQMGQQARVLDDLLRNYVTHVFGKEHAGLMEEFFAGRSGGGSVNTPYAQTRTGPPTIREVNHFLRSKGARPITDDIAVIMESYGRSLVQAVANKGVIDALKVRTAPLQVGNQVINRPLIMGASSKDIPRGYVPFGKEGLRAHPDIVAPLRFLFDQATPAGFMRGVEATVTATKRIAVNFSMFHALSLQQAFMGADKMRWGYPIAGAAVGAGAAVLAGKDDPVTYAMITGGLAGMIPSMRRVGQAAKPNTILAPMYGAAIGYGLSPDDHKMAGTAAGLGVGLLPRMAKENPYVRAMRVHDPAMAATIDLLIQRGGLKVSFEKGSLAVDDVSNSFYAGMLAARNIVDKIIPWGGKGVDQVIKLNHATDGFLWERLHTGDKLEIGMAKYEIATENNTRANQKNPTKYPLKTADENAVIASTFANDAFGGINWRRAAEESRTAWGRDLMMNVYSPTGRRVLQLVEFAPDWLLSTTRMALHSFGSGTDVRGLFKPQELADFSRQYMLRSAFYYSTIAYGLNMYFTGHPFWENRDKDGNLDPYHVYLGDGRKMSISKHYLEPFHLATEPMRTMLGKESVPLREASNQLMGTEFLTTQPKPPFIGGPPMGFKYGEPITAADRFAHFGRSMLPITVQQGIGDSGMQAWALGNLGIGIQGSTDQMKKERKDKRAADKLKRAQQ